MLIAFGVLSGILTGVQLAALWGLRRAKRVRAELLLVALALVPTAYYYGAEAFGWPTPGSLAESAGLLDEFADRWRLLGIAVGTAVVVIAVLVRSGATRRLESWSSKPE